MLTEELLPPSLTVNEFLRVLIALQLRTIARHGQTGTVIITLFAWNVKLHMSQPNRRGGGVMDINEPKGPGSQWTRLDAAQQAVERLEQQVAQLREELHRWKCELCNLTPGGSEFADDPAFCAEYVRKARDSQHDMIVKTVKERKALQTAHTTLRGLVEKANYELAALFPVPDSPTFENAFTVCSNKNPADARCILNAYEAIHEAATLPREGGVQSCVWVDDAGGTYATGCKEFFQVYAESEEAPKWVKFCCYCGKPVEHFVADPDGGEHE